MADGKNWAITQLGRGTSLELQIDFTTSTLATALVPAKTTTKTVKYTVAQFTAGWAVNEIPNAQCLLAIGRDVRELVRAEINATASQLKQMRKCRVIFRPDGEFDVDGTKWPAEFVIFDGYFMGLAYGKVNGKVQIIANLKHWLIDLACSSTLTNNSHPLNPLHLTARAICYDLTLTGASNSHYVSKLIGQQLISKDVIADVWGGIKKLFCALANVDAIIGASEQEGMCGFTGNAVKNDRARNALARMEGPAKLPGSDCTKKRVFSVPLYLDLFNIPQAEEALANGICQASVESFANTTFWDKLVGEFCPMFVMAVVPAVDYAVVIADTPAYQGGPWKTIETGEYDSFQMQADLERPLRAVGVTAEFGSSMGANEAGQSRPSSTPQVGGCHAENLDEPNDGIIHYVTAPSWIQCLVSYGHYSRGTSGLGEDAASLTATTTNANGGTVPQETADFTADVNKLLNRYAQSVFVANMLRGRVGMVGGKLRFDVAPGSIIKVRGSEEKFLAGEDELATNMVGCVSRMTIAINAEAGIAGTTFVLSHLRTEAENKQTRTSVAQHPLFQKAIHGGGKHGSPLVVGHEKLSP